MPTPIAAGADARGCTDQRNPEDEPGEQREVHGGVANQQIDEVLPKVVHVSPALRRRAPPALMSSYARGRGNLSEKKAVRIRRTP